MSDDEIMKARVIAAVMNETGNPARALLAVQQYELVKTYRCLGECDRYTWLGDWLEDAPPMSEEECLVKISIIGDETNRTGFPSAGVKAGEEFELVRAYSTFDPNRRKVELRCMKEFAEPYRASEEDLRAFGCEG